MFAQYKKESKLNEALDKLINCFEKILNEPDFKLDKKTRENLKTIINSIKNNKNGSESAIRSATASGHEFIKTLIPQLEAYSKWCVFAKDFYDVYSEISTELVGVGMKVREFYQDEFMTDSFILTKPVGILPPKELKNNLLPEGVSLNKASK